MNISELLISIANKVKELKPFKSAVNSVYSWLEERVRGSEDGTIPTIELPKTKDAENIVENLSVLNSRDLVSGLNITDGMGLIRLFLDNSINTDLLYCEDNNKNWVADTIGGLNAIINLNVKKIYINCKSITQNIWDAKYDGEVEIHFPYCTYLERAQLLSVRSESSSARPKTSIFFDVLEDLSNWNKTYNYPYIIANRIYFPSLKRGLYHNGAGSAYNNATTTYIYVGCKGSKNDIIEITNSYTGYVNKIVECVEIGENARQPLRITNLHGLTPDNIERYIFNKLADNNYDDNGNICESIIIEIGQENIDKLTEEQIAIVTSKNYTLI